MSEETLQTIEDCGATEMSISEMCEIVGINEDAYLADKAAQRRYRAGQLKSKFEIRKAVVAMAKDGAAAMIKIYADFAAANGSSVAAADEDFADL